MLEYCIREDLKLKQPAYDGCTGSDQVWLLTTIRKEQMEYAGCCRTIWKMRSLGASRIPFCRELYIERDDFMEEPPKKYFRLFPGNEVRLMNAYFVKCTSFEKDENGNVTVVHCTYDPETKSGSGFAGTKGQRHHSLGGCSGSA